VRPGSVDVRRQLQCRSLDLLDQVLVGGLKRRWVDSSLLDLAARASGRIVLAGV
jgi:hypothetical protein